MKCQKSVIELYHIASKSVEVSCVIPWWRYEEWQRKGKLANMDYAFHMAVTSWSAKIAEEMEVTQSVVALTVTF